MVAVYPARQSRAARWSRRTAIFAVILFVVAGASHRFGHIDTETFALTLCLTGILIAVAVAAFLLAFHRMWTRGDKVGWDLFVAGLFLLIAIAPFGVSAYRAATTPMLHDISTDLEDRPLLAPVAARRPAMNQPRGMTLLEAEEQRAAYPEVVGHTYGLPVAHTRRIVRALVMERGWRIVRDFSSASGSAATMNAVAGSYLLGFFSDVAIRVSDDEGGSLVDMRSASRYGRHDLGDNAARIERFLADLDAAVLTDATAPPPVQ